MYKIAFKMLTGDRAKYIGIVLGITFSAFVITQQASIFTGLMTRTFGFITDTTQPNLWIMDSKVQFIDDIKPLQDTQLYRVRGISGIEWAMPLYKGILKARLSTGLFQNCNVIGIDDQTLIGGPPEMLYGKLEDLRITDSIIVDEVGANGRLAKVDPITKIKTPLGVGDILELNDKRAVVVGIAKVSRTFQSQPVIYTTYSRAVTFAPKERKLLSFIIAKYKDGTEVSALKDTIKQRTGLISYTRPEFIEVTYTYFLKNTGIPINFGIAVLLGLVVGTAIAGQTFFNFTLDNLKYFATLKAMGAANFTLTKMIVLQSLIVGFTGYGIGVGGASMFYFISLKSELAFRLTWQLILLSAGAVTFICILAALISIIKVVRLDPAVVFKS